MFRKIKSTDDGAIAESGTFKVILSFVIVHIVPVLILTRGDPDDFLKES